MKLSDVLQAVRLIKAGNHHGAQFHKHLPTLKYMDMIPGGVGHQSPYGHVLFHPHYGHHGPISGLASVAHGLKLGGTGSTASGAYGGGHSSPAHHSIGYGGHMGVPNGGHPAPAGYDYHPALEPHVPIADTTGPHHATTAGKSKTSGSSTVTALTLLSFLFFLNILQGCLKEHMDTMNPTVMVMTAGVARTRVSKLAEINSREQQHTIAQSLPSLSGQTMNRGEPVVIGAGSSSSITNDEQVPFSGGNTKIEYGNQRPDPEPEYYSAYANRTMTLVDNNYQDHHHRPYHHHHQRVPGSFSSPSSASLSSSSSASASNPDGNNYYPDTMDPYYMRIN